jgi:hypothetical protein
MTQRTLLLGVTGLGLTLSVLGCGREGRLTLHSSRGPDQGIPRRVTGLEPDPAGEATSPPSPEEAFRAVVEREGRGHPPSAEAIRLAEEHEKRERQRAEEQLRTVEQYERAARGE